MLALELYRSTARYLGARAIGSRLPGTLAGPVAPLRLSYREEPRLPGPDWVTVRPLLAGICGSDLGTIAATNSLYFSALVSLPFVLGHEVVGEVVDGNGDRKSGRRVVLDPLLTCAARGIEPPCRPCAEGSSSVCDRVTGGHLSPGLQSGYCRDTGGGWSQAMVAHVSQLHDVPDDVADEDAVMVEPMACALHAVRRARIPDDADVAIVGAGTVGLLTLFAVREFSAAGRVTVVAKHEQQAALARRYGATDVVSPSAALGSIRRSTRAFRADPDRAAPFLLGGVDVAFDCVGAKSSLELALRVARGTGRVVLSGMPAKADLSPAWFRELEVVGAYSGAGEFETAMEMASAGELGKLVGATYPLERWREAIDHALSGGSLGCVKVAFDSRLDD